MVTKIMHGALGLVALAAVWAEAYAFAAGVLIVTWVIGVIHLASCRTS